MADDRQERRPEPQQAEADRLDADIAGALAGRPSPPRRSADPTVLWLAAAMRPSPPPELARRVLATAERAEARRWGPARLAAGVLASLLFAQGFGNLAWGDWVARGLGEAHSHHAYLEGGLVLIAMAVVVAAGFLDRRALPVSVAGGGPLGIALGLNGLTEIGQFTAGLVLHGLEGVAAIALLVLWWRARRYSRAPADEGGA